jgi:UDP-N-acetylmuramoylalanine--D-glutamate ligase
VIPERWRRGEIAVVGLARSGQAACRLLRRQALAVYASDAKDTPDLRAAAERLNAEGCAVELGRHDLARIARASAVVVSPGVAPASEPYTAAARALVPIVAELDLAARCLPDTRLIVTTGTKGKSTTSALIAKLLATAGLGPAEAAGNIGTPLADVALQPRAPAWLAVEASSYQLHDAPALAPAVGVLTNLSPDHLDRYAGLEEYYADKALLFRNASERSRWVTNGDDAEVAKLAGGRPGAHERFSVAVRLADAWYDRAAGWLVLRGLPLVRRTDLQLLGDHNVANALAAALSLPLSADREAIAAGLRDFRALAHRLEPVREVNGVLWIDDSKSTTVASTLSAVRSVGRPVVLLLGGKDKGGDFAQLAEALSGCRGVIAYGDAGERVERELKGSLPLVRERHDFAAVIARARALARPGDAVLLSPACASFDMFASAEDRGRQFRALVEAS